MQLKVGSHYVTRNGAYIVRVTGIRKDGVAYFKPIYYEHSCCWPDGRVAHNRKDHEGDLVAEVNPISIKLEDLL